MEIHDVRPIGPFKGTGSVLDSCACQVQLQARQKRCPAWRRTAAAQGSGVNRWTLLYRRMACLGPSKQYLLVGCCWLQSRRFASAGCTAARPWQATQQRLLYELRIAPAHLRACPPPCVHTPLPCAAPCRAACKCARLLPDHDGCRAPPRQNRAAHANNDCQCHSPCRYCRRTPPSTGARQTCPTASPAPSAPGCPASGPPWTSACTGAAAPSGKPAAARHMACLPSCLPAPVDCGLPMGYATAQQSLMLLLPLTSLPRKTHLHPPPFSLYVLAGSGFKQQVHAVRASCTTHPCGRLWAALPSPPVPSPPHLTSPLPTTPPPTGQQNTSCMLFHDPTRPRSYPDWDAFLWALEHNATSALAWPKLRVQRAMLRLQAHLERHVLVGGWAVGR